MGLAPNTALAVVTAACGDSEWADVDARRRLAAGNAGETKAAVGGFPTGRTLCGALTAIRVVVLATPRAVTRGAGVAGERTAPVDDPESGASAEAVAAPANAAAPMPRATANPPTRPTNREAPIMNSPREPVSEMQRSVMSDPV